MAPSIAIVGSGFLGLTLALRFSKLGWNVTVFEAASQIGGLASAWQIGDIIWDRHYHVTLLSDRSTRSIVEEVGLKDQFCWAETKTGFYSKGQLYSMSNAMEFMQFPILGLVGKLRLGATIFYASRIRNWKALESISVSEWLAKLSGKKTFEKIWLPLLRAKLGDSYKETSAAFIWATIQRLYAARKSGMKKEMFGYVSGGYSNVLSHFEALLVKNGVQIELDSKITSIKKCEDGKVQIGSNSSGSLRDFDIAVLTCPSDIAADIVPQLEEGERSRLRSIRYQGIVCASVLLKKPISDFYITNIVEDSPFTGVIEMSALVDKTEFGGNSLVYLPKYADMNDPIFMKTDEEIREYFLSSLERMYKNFSQDDVLDFRVSRVGRVFPLPVLNYSQTVPDPKTSLDNVFIVNSSHIVNGTLNVNETIQLAERFSKRLIEQYREEVTQ